MPLVKVVVWARKFHRILVVFITISGLIMMVTGIVMRENMEEEQFLPFIDPITARIVHGNTSTIFAVFLGLMMLTGIFLFLYPWIIKMTKKTPVAHPTPSPTEQKV